MERETMTIKEKIESLRTELKALKVQARKEKRAGRKPLLRRFTRTLDDLFLGLVEKMNERATAIRYKQANPRGHEADELVDAIDRLLQKYKDKLDKGKALNTRHYKALVRADEVLEEVIQSKAGTRQHRASVLRKQIRDFIPEEMLAVDNLDKIISSMMEDMKDKVKKAAPIPQTQGQ
jgi:hypothetical protein